MQYLPRIDINAKAPNARIAVNSAVRLFNTPKRAEWHFELPTLAASAPATEFTDAYANAALPATAHTVLKRGVNPTRFTTSGRARAASFIIVRPEFTNPSKEEIRSV